MQNTQPNTSAKDFDQIENHRKSVLITGANQGIGLATAIELAKHGGFDIYLVCRNERKAMDAVSRIKMVNTSVEVRYLLADFSRMTSVLRTIEKIKSEGLLFDVVILNAGVLLPKERNTEDGFETTFQVNYLAQYQLLIAVIQNQTRRKAPMTVITLTSALYKLCGPFFCVTGYPLRWLSMLTNSSQNQWKAYAMSKAALALLATSVNSIPHIKGITINPGVVHTKMFDAVRCSIGGNCIKCLRMLLKHIVLTPETAATNIIQCILDSEKFLPGEYLNVNCKAQLSNFVQKEQNQQSLIKFSDELIYQFNQKMSCMNT